MRDEGDQVEITETTDIELRRKWSRWGQAPKLQVGANEQTANCTPDPDPRPRLIDHFRDC
jgi:hypothetical protein